MVKPILFNTDMVRAIQSSAKTVTRRVIKMDNHTVFKMACSAGKCYNNFHPDSLPENIVEWYAKEYAKAPYRSGDVLWVRETWTHEGAKHYFRADFDSDFLEPCETLSGGYPHECTYHPGCDGCTRERRRILWRPSIHMPKEAARLFLRVTDVRMEQLREMNVNDFLREGICLLPKTYANAIDCVLAHAEKFKEIWDSTIKPADLPLYGWTANPWVWVIEFGRCETPAGWPMAGEVPHEA